MSTTTAASPSLSGRTAYTPSTTTSGSTAYTPSSSTPAISSQPPAPAPPQSTFQFPTYTSFPPFYTLQPNLTTRARQLDLWSSLITSYCAHHRIFKLSASALPEELTGNAALRRRLAAVDVRAVLEHMAAAGVVEWVPVAGSGGRGEPAMTTCWVWWRSAAEWADALYAWVEATGQKGAVLTVYELREGSEGNGWSGMDESMLRKVLGVLVKRGKSQIFGGQVGDGEGVKFF